MDRSKAVSGLGRFVPKMNDMSQHISLSPNEYSLFLL